MTRWREVPDPDGADWEWRCLHGLIQGRRPGGVWAYVGNPSPETIIDGKYIGQRTPKRAALWASLVADPTEEDVA